MNRTSLRFLAVFFFYAPLLHAAPLTVKVEDVVAVDRVQRIGFNIDFSIYWGLTSRKNLVSDNFEGTTYRYAMTASEQDA